MSSYTFTWPAGPNEVILTGSFDNWSKSLPLVKQADGSFELTVPLPPVTEKLLYKYVVDGEWLVSKTQNIDIDAQGNDNNVLEASDLVSTSAVGGAFIPESGLHSKSVAPAKDGELKTTVLPSSEGVGHSLSGEPGVVIPKDPEALAAFSQVRDVDPKTLNEPEEPELTPEERQKQKKKVKRTQYKAKKKKNKASGSPEDTSEEQTPEPETGATAATVAGGAAALGAAGIAAVGAGGAAILGAGALGASTLTGSDADAPKVSEPVVPGTFDESVPDVKGDVSAAEGAIPDVKGDLSGVEGSVPAVDAKVPDFEDGVTESKSSKPDFEDGLAGGAVAGVAGGVAAAKGDVPDFKESAKGVEGIAPEIKGESADLETAAPHIAGDVSDVPKTLDPKADDVLANGEPAIEKEVDASPITKDAKAATKNYDSDEEIVIAQGEHKDIAAAIAAQEGDVTVEEIQPTESERARLTAEAKKAGADSKTAVGAAGDNAVATGEAAVADAKAAGASTAAKTTKSAAAATGAAGAKDKKKKKSNFLVRFFKKLFGSSSS